MHRGEGKESCALCPGETIGPSNLQWRLESSRSSVSSRVCQVRVGDHEGEIRDQVTLGLMNFQSVPGLGQGLIWPRLHPGWVSAAHSVPPSDTPCGSFHPQPQPGASLQTHLEGLWVTPPSLGALCTPRRTSPDRLSSQLPCHRLFSEVAPCAGSSVTPTGGPSHSITAGRAEAVHCSDPPLTCQPLQEAETTSPSPLPPLSSRQPSGAWSRGIPPLCLTRTLPGHALSPPGWHLPPGSPGLALWRAAPRREAARPWGTGFRGFREVSPGPAGGG